MKAIMNNAAEGQEEQLESKREITDFILHLKKLLIKGMKQERSYCRKGLEI